MKYIQIRRISFRRYFSLKRKKKEEINPYRKYNTGFSSKITFESLYKVYITRSTYFYANNRSRSTVLPFLISTLLNKIDKANEERNARPDSG